MEALGILGLTERDVRKVSVETANSIDELNSLSSYIEGGKAPKNIEDAYKSLYKQVENYLFSSEFKKEAKKVGVTVSVSEKEEDIVVAEIPKVKSKTLSERIAERKNKKSVSESEEPVVEVIKEKPVVKDIDISTEQLFGVQVKGTKGGEIVGRDKFSMMLSYGQTDYILGFLENSVGFHYRLNLPLSLGHLVFSFSNLSNNGQHKSILDVWKAYTEDNTATLNLVSRSEEQLENLSNVLGFITVVKERLPLSVSQLKNEKYSSELYEDINDIYSRSIGNSTYYDIDKYLKASWSTKNVASNSSTLPSAYTYGIQYGDYVYTSAENMYSKGGVSIVAKKYTFYVPKGLSKKETFGEIGTHLKETSLKTSKFEKDIEIGKRFQVSMGKIEDAVECRVIGSEYSEKKLGSIYIADEAGDSWVISSKAYNYFLKYYGFVSLKISDNTIVVFYNGSVVGIISAEKLSSKEIVGMFDIEQFKTELRSIDTDAYDFMVSEMVEVEESTKGVIDKVEEEEEKGGDEEDLKKELIERIDFLEELLEDAIEEGDNQTLIDELNMELESLNDLLDDIE